MKIPGYIKDIFNNLEKKKVYGVGSRGEKEHIFYPGFVRGSLCGGIKVHPSITEMSKGCSCGNVCNLCQCIYTGITSRDISRDDPVLTLILEGEDEA